MTAPLDVLPEVCPACGQPKVYEAVGSAGYACGLQFLSAFNFGWEKTRDVGCKHAYDLAVRRGERIEQLMASLEACARERHESRQGWGQ